VIARVNELARECRPLGHVKAIMKSPHREREIMVTLNVMDKERLDDENFLKMLTDNQSGNTKKAPSKQDSIASNKIAANSGIYAVPISKKLPWMSLANIPPELISDV
jgi:hypothetical protein